MKSPFKYSLVSIRNLFGLSQMDIIDAIHAGYILVVGDGENIDSYYTNQTGKNFFKKLKPEIGRIGINLKTS